MTDENELNELRGIAERLGANDFIDVGSIVRDLVDEKWVNPTGAYNIALKNRLTALSSADDWAEAKLEWKATGNIWYVPMRETADDVLPSIHQESHPHECICGHKIAWHFEIINTENELREIVGSEHIGFWMVARHLIENLDMPADMITLERIEIWVKESVKSMKADWWWKQYGEQFEEWFEAVSEADIRENSRDGDSYWDTDTNRYEHQKLIRKKAVGKMGEPEYGMSSIFWRWNHPDNTGVFYTNNKTGIRIKKTTWEKLGYSEKWADHPTSPYRKVSLWDKTVESTAQKDTRGWPNQRLWNDLQIFYFDLPNVLEKHATQDAERAKRVEFVIKERREQEEKNRIREEEEEKARVIRRKERQLRQEEQQRLQIARDAEKALKMETALEDFCSEHNLPIFSESDGSNNWECTFLTDMLTRINRLASLSPKQIEYIAIIVNKEEQPATEKQLSYIRSLGGEPTNSMTKRQASDLIGELKNPSKVVNIAEEEE